jgi:hypothetical protein
VLTHLKGTGILESGKQSVAVSKDCQNIGPVNPIHVGSKLEDEYELSIPVEHTTAAHKLLTWPSIQLLLTKEYDENYVMLLEEDRCPLSIYGHGEILDTLGNGQLPLDGGFYSKSPGKDGMGLDEDVDVDMLGNVKLDAVTAQRYFESYLSKMYTLHPFLDRRELSSKVNSFIQLYCNLDISQKSATDNVRSAHDDLPSPKRMRSNHGLGVSSDDMQASCNSRGPRVGRNIDNCIVLLCLALGAICEAPAPLPGPIIYRRIGYRTQTFKPPLLAQIETDTANSMLSPTMRDEHAHMNSFQANPGLALYGYATGILGHLQGANELEHVQAGLLAGLYAGQLAHPIQSHSWISQASRACQVLVRPKRYERLSEGPVKDLHSSAYWACLQLESDLLAELDIPASGISRSEGRIQLPQGQFAITLPDDLSASSSLIMMFYSAQIHLRRILNRAHSELYNVKRQGGIQWSSTVQEALSENLDLWRRYLPDGMQWKETDGPANEINAARMRAKYYGARYIIHRPLLYHALHNNTCARIKVQTTAASLANGWTAPQVQLRTLPKKLQNACKICIDSAIRSTVAFDGVGGHRLVVTNIFGTAHA